MADRTVREFTTQAPAGYVGQFLQGGIFPYAQRFLQGQFANMGAPDSSPYTYTGPRVARFDPREYRGMNLADQAIGSYSPFLGRQAGLLNRATGYLQGGTGAGTELTGEAAGLYRGAGRDFSPTAYQDYMSPYTENVIDRSLGDIREQMEKQKMGIRDKAVTAGAFGGSRGRLAQEDVERAGLRSMGDISAQYREKGYGQSQEQAFQEFARRQAERATMAGGIAGLGQQYYGMGTGAGQGLMNIGGQYGAIAPSLQNLQTGDINRQMQLGGLGRGRQQSLMDLGYQNFTGQYNLPMQTLQNVGALTASLGPMAGGYGFAGADQDVALAGLPQYAPATGGIGVPGAGTYQPYAGSNVGGGTPTPTPPIGGPPGGGPPPGGPGGGYPIVSPFNYNTYGANMPIAAAEGKPLTQLGRRMTATEKLEAEPLTQSGRRSKILSDRDLVAHLLRDPSGTGALDALGEGTEWIPVDELSDLQAEAGTNQADLVRLLLGQEGRETSDRDVKLAYMLAAAEGQTGRTLSDLVFLPNTYKDFKDYLDMIGRTTSDRDTKRGKPGYNRRAYGGGIGSIV